MKEQEKFTIYAEPMYWDSLAGGVYGLETVKFPYTSIVISVVGNAIKDQNGFGWDVTSFKKANKKYFLNNSSFQININLI